MNLESIIFKLNEIKDYIKGEKLFYILVVLFFVFVASIYEQPIKNEVVVFEDEPIVELESLNEIKETIPPKKDLYAFLDALAFKESSNRYHVQNQYGYMGKYQFGQSTLKGLGYNVTRHEFINNPELQEQAMIDLLLHNREYLLSYIERWEGEVVNGVKITESGILAAAHLGGQRNVRNFFRYNRDFSDGNGTRLSYYMKRFGGYDIGLDSMKTDYIADIPQKMITNYERQLETR